MDATQLDDFSKTQLAQLAIELANDPETRPMVNKKTKVRGSPMMDVELADMKAEMRKEFEDRDQKSQQEKIKRQLETQRNGLIDRGYKEEDVSKIETDYMQKHGIGDYDLAAKLYAADQKPADPSYEIQTRTWQMPNFTKEQIMNPKELDRRAREGAYQTLAEMRAKRA